MSTAGLRLAGACRRASSLVAPAVKLDTPIRTALYIIFAVVAVSVAIYGLGALIALLTGVSSFNATAILAMGIALGSLGIVAWIDTERS